MLSSAVSVVRQTVMRTRNNISRSTVNCQLVCVRDSETVVRADGEF